MLSSFLLSPSTLRLPRITKSASYSEVGGSCGSSSSTESVSRSQAGEDVKIVVMDANVTVRGGCCGDGGVTVTTIPSLSTAASTPPSLLSEEEVGRGLKYQAVKKLQ